MAWHGMMRWFSRVMEWDEQKQRSSPRASAPTRFQPFFLSLFRFCFVLALLSPPAHRIASVATPRRGREVVEVGVGRGERRRKNADPGKMPRRMIPHTTHTRQRHTRFPAAGRPCHPPPTYPRTQIHSLHTRIHRFIIYRPTCTLIHTYTQHTYIHMNTHSYTAQLTSTHSPPKKQG
jgi:hypothetical protein